MAVGGPTQPPVSDLAKLGSLASCAASPAFTFGQASAAAVRVTALSASRRLADARKSLANGSYFVIEEMPGRANSLPARTRGFEGVGWERWVGVWA